MNENSPLVHPVHKESGEAGARTPPADSRAQGHEPRVSSPDGDVVREALNEVDANADLDAAVAALARLEARIAELERALRKIRHTFGPHAFPDDYREIARRALAEEPHAAFNERPLRPHPPIGDDLAEEPHADEENA